MALNIMPTDRHGCFNLYEEGERIGSIVYEREGEGSDTIEAWEVEIWSAMGTGKVWDGGDPESEEEAFAAAHEAYKEFVAERRELSRPLRGISVISTPTGGQRRRR